MLAEQLIKAAKMAEKEGKKRNVLKEEVERLYSEGCKPKEILKALNIRGIKTMQGNAPKMHNVSHYIYKHRAGFKKGVPKRGVAPVKQTTFVTKNFDTLLNELVDKKVEAALKKALRSLVG